MQEIVYLVNTEGDIEESDRTPVNERFNFLELTPDFPGLEQPMGFKRFEKEDPPRLLKTHLSSHFFKKTLENRKTKFIVVFRNPKDMLASYYNFYRMGHFDFDSNGSWEEFFERFRNNKIVHGNYFDMQLSWWAYRDDPRVKIFKYEDMLKDPEQAVRQVATFLEKDLSDELIQKIVQRTSFKTMKDNPALNYSNTPGVDISISPFMRKGKVGDWKNYFNEGQKKYVDALSKKKFEPEGLFLIDELNL